ncbi:MAG: HAMP domain-containing histidine kinase [Bacteriovorax sp.]|nr:HAMP domain-containing histidine kinase [Bacteriovorax sp.]
MVNTQTEVPIEQKTYHQLEILYDISKVIASFETLEKTFPILMALAAKAIPIQTSILTEGRGATTTTTIWQNKDVPQEHIKEAVTMGNQFYTQLTDPTYRLNLKANQIVPGVNFIALPLVSYLRPTFGMLVMEGKEKLDEGDLAFADAITNLISIALDRYYTANDLKKLKEESILDLEEERDQREVFVTTLTHDLRNSLGSVKMNAGMIYKTNNPETCKLMSKKIIGSIERVDHMIENLLDANRIKAGEKLPLKFEEIDLQEMLKSVIEDLTDLPEDRIELKGNQKIYGYWSRDGIRRAIDNLISNALKYGATNHPILVSLSQTNQNVQIAIHNEGPPIAAEDIANLFQMHQRTKSALASGVRGWGIGLTLVRGMVEAHGGSVQVESSKELGTTFTMVLPKDNRSN